LKTLSVENKKVIFDLEVTFKEKCLLRIMHNELIYSQKECVSENKYLYNAKELQDEQIAGVSLEWYDYQARFYDPQIGRFTTIDPFAEEASDYTPYNYVRNNPILKIDPTGKWDITVHVYNNREKYGYGVAIVTDRNRKEIARYDVRVIGQDRDRMSKIKNGDTPLGTYDIPDNFKDMWMSGGSIASFGPNNRLVINTEKGEAKESGRDQFRMHGGRQGKNDHKQEPDEPLQPTNGCIRMYDNDIANMYTIIDNLMSNDPEEIGGKTYVIDDLKQGQNWAGIPFKSDQTKTTYYIPGENASEEGKQNWNNFVNSILRRNK